MRPNAMKDELLHISDKIIKGLKKKGADDVIVISTKSDKLMVRFSDNKVTVSQSWNTMGAEALSIFGKRKVISSFGNLQEDALRRSIERAAKEAEFASDSAKFEPLPKGRKFEDRFTDSQVDVDAVNDQLSIAVNAALRNGAERVAGVFTATIGNTSLLSTGGAEGYSEKSVYELNIRGFNGEASGQGLSCGTKISKLVPERAGTEAGIYAKEGKTTIEWHAGKYCVILGQIICANLLEAVGDASSAFNIEAGISCLEGKLGKQALSKKLTIVDDGSDETALNSRMFDDEGVPTKKNTIVEDGVLRKYLHNTETAKRFGTKSTGNAGWINPSPWNLQVNAGNFSHEEMLDGLKDGVYMVSNWYTRFQNYGTGDFSTICRDGTFLVRNGEIKGAIKGARVSDNLLRVFNSVDVMGKERRWIHWWEVDMPTLLPAMMVSEVNLTKAQEK
jgi:PmbA protein